MCSGLLRAICRHSKAIKLRQFGAVYKLPSFALRIKVSASARNYCIKWYPVCRLFMINIAHFINRTPIKLVICFCSIICSKVGIIYSWNSVNMSGKYLKTQDWPRHKFIKSSSTHFEWGVDFKFQTVGCLKFDDFLLDDCSKRISVNAKFWITSYTTPKIYCCSTVRIFYFIRITSSSVICRALTLWFTSNAECNSGLMVF